MTVAAYSRQGACVITSGTAQNNLARITAHYQTRPNVWIFPTRSSFYFAVLPNMVLRPWACLACWCELWPTRPTRILKWIRSSNRQVTSSTRALTSYVILCYSNKTKLPNLTDFWKLKWGIMERIKPRQLISTLRQPIVKCDRVVQRETQTTQTRVRARAICSSRANGNFKCKAHKSVLVLCPLFDTIISLLEYKILTSLTSLSMQMSIILLSFPAI